MADAETCILRERKEFKTILMPVTTKEYDNPQGLFGQAPADCYKSGFSKKSRFYSTLQVVFLMCFCPVPVNAQDTGKNNSAVCAESFHDAE